LISALDGSLSPERFFRKKDHILSNQPNVVVNGGRYMPVRFHLELSSLLRAPGPISDLLLNKSFYLVLQRSKRFFEFREMAAATVTTERDVVDNTVRTHILRKDLKIAVRAEGVRIIDPTVTEVSPAPAKAEKDVCCVVAP
jgi:hypothetical protein